ncbi:FAD binding domain-containing protein [Mesorhizobium sp. IMUNJ 23232]|uniref:FAD binding domain-containing protein n=1 Tax=Mesorhizobium sp. IMUNJ 23232 TaxID=3376064 RepID=UPI0037AE888E
MPLALKTFANVNDAGAALKADGARYLGGGTLVVRAANEGDVSLSTFVRSTDPALLALSVEGSRVTIGASVTMAAMARHPALAPIASAARAVGGPAIRNMATVGGNLFAPAPYGDFAVALLALDAEVLEGSQATPIEAFLKARDPAAGRIVSAVRFDVPEPKKFRFVKVARVKPKGVSVLSIAVLLDEAADGTIRTARIALGCMADRPMRAKAAEQALVGRKRTAEGITPALAVAAEGTAPITDAIASAWYRAEVLPVHLGRLLLG